MFNAYLRSITVFISMFSGHFTRRVRKHNSNRRCKMCSYPSGGVPLLQSWSWSWNSTQQNGPSACSATRGASWSPWTPLPGSDQEKEDPRAAHDSSRCSFDKWQSNFKSLHWNTKHTFEHNTPVHFCAGSERSYVHRSFTLGSTQVEQFLMQIAISVAYPVSRRTRVVFFSVINRCKCSHKPSVSQSWSLTAHLAVEYSKAVQGVQILLKQVCTCWVQVYFIQLQHCHGYPEEGLVHRRVLKGKRESHDFQVKKSITEH